MLCILVSLQSPTACHDKLQLAITKLKVLGLAKLVEPQFNHQSEGHTGVLQHVIEGQMLNGILPGVDVRIRLAKLRLDDKGRGVASLGSRGMVGASIAALGLDPGNVAIL